MKTLAKTLQKTLATLLRHGLRWPLEAALFYPIAAIFIILPTPAASALGGALCRIIAPLTPFHKRALFNIAYAMPELKPPQHRQIIHKMWWHLGRNIGEYFHTKTIMDSDRITFDGLEHIQKLKPKGGFLVSGHIGNWEIGIAPARKQNLPLYAVFRRINNPLITKLLARRRQFFQDVFEKGFEGAKGMTSSLKKGGVFIAVIDQKLREGVMLDFFGHKAATAIAHIKMADKFDVPILTIQVIRKPKCRFHIVIKHIDLNDFDRTHPDFLTTVATHINQHIEGWIRQNPEQWMWPHRRWPASKGEKYTHPNAKPHN